MERPLILLGIGLTAELVLILPFVDAWADANPTVHFTQHGLIFVGGVLMGFAFCLARYGNRRRR